MAIAVTIPEMGFLHLAQIIGDKNADPIIPISKTAWYIGVKKGRFPAPVRLGIRTYLWLASEILAPITNSGAAV